MCSARSRHRPERRVGHDDAADEVGPGAGQAERERAAPVVADDVDAPAGHLGVDERGSWATSEATSKGPE